VTAHVGYRMGNRLTVFTSWDTFVEIAGGVMVIVVALIAVVILPFWLLWHAVGPWAHLGLLALAAVWWIVWRPISAYRKAKRA
jgi:hypothetical protein